MKIYAELLWDSAENTSHSCAAAVCLCIRFSSPEIPISQHQEVFSVTAASEYTQLQKFFRNPSPSESWGPGDLLGPERDLPISFPLKESALRWRKGHNFLVWH